MRFRPLHLAILVFQAIWLNVIVPGHQRGVVPVPGSVTTATAEEGCSACRASAPKSASAKSKTQKNSPGNCAVCFFAAHMGLPPVIVWPLEPLGLSHRVMAERAEQRVAAIVLLPFDCRGPPAVA